MSSAASDTIAIADAIDKGGVAFVLVVVLIGLGYLYIQERRRNDRLAMGLIENNKEMMSAMHDVDMSIQSFKDLLAGLKPYIEELVHERKRR